jgi:hypothetical protein
MFEIAKMFAENGWDVFIISRSFSKWKDLLSCLNIKILVEKEDKITFVRIPYIPSASQPFLMYNTFWIKQIHQPFQNRCCC